MKHDSRLPLCKNINQGRFHKMRQSIRFILDDLAKKTDY